MEKFVMRSDLVLLCIKLSFVSVPGSNCTVCERCWSFAFSRLVFPFLKTLTGINMSLMLELHRH